MTVKSGAAWTGSFVTLDATGAIATPSVGPTGALYVAGVATADSVTISGSNPYKFSVTLPALTAGQSVEMYITATIASIATAAFVARELADTKLMSDLNDAAAAPTAEAVADAVLDEAQSGHSGHLATAIPAAAAGASGGLPILGSNATGMTLGQVKITADVANEGALHIANANAGGYGQCNTSMIGQYNSGTETGQWNSGANYGQYNYSSDGTGQANVGDIYGQNNSGTTPVYPAPASATDMATLLARILGTLDTGTHKPQSGDAYAYLGTNLGALGVNLTAADDAVLAAIAALNNLSSAGAQAAAAAALLAYGVALEATSQDILADTTALVGGAGPSTVVYTTTVDGVPTAGVYCRLCTDTSGLVNISAGTSDSLGHVTFAHNLPTGTTVYIFPSKDGVEFDFGGVPYDTETIP